MTGDIVTDEQIKRIDDLLSSVEIRYSKTSDGTFTASTTTEPLFCFSRETTEELAQVVLATFVSYIDNFWDGGTLDITIEPASAVEPSLRPAPPPIPIHAMVPYSRARAAVRRAPRRELESA